MSYKAKIVQLWCKTMLPVCSYTIFIAFQVFVAICFTIPLPIICFYNLLLAIIMYVVNINKPYMLGLIKYWELLQLVRLSELEIHFLV